MFSAALRRGREGTAAPRVTWADGTSQAQATEASTQRLPPLQASEADCKCEVGATQNHERLDLPRASRLE